jgi:hypothetical protein
MRCGRRDNGKIRPDSHWIAGDRHDQCGRRSRQGACGQMDDRTKHAVFDGRGCGFRRCREVGRSLSAGADGRGGAGPAGGLRAMHVIEQNDQLDGEREKRAPRPKSKVRSNPAHLGVNPSAISRGGLVLLTCFGKVASPRRRYLSRYKHSAISPPDTKYVNAAMQHDGWER